MSPVEAPERELTEADWMAAIVGANLSGDYLKAVDIASRALAEHPQSLPLVYQRALGFARVGSPVRAQQELDTVESDGRLAACPDRKLHIDFAALRGRLLKDRATLARDAAERAALSAEAAAVYEEVFHQWRGCFPAVNAATLWQVAGQPDRAAEMARSALAEASDETDPYWRLASEGEAWLHLGDEARAVQSFSQASEELRGRFDAIAATRRQLAWLAQSTGIGAAALDALAPPSVLRWFVEPGRRLDDADRRSLVAHSGKAGLIAFGALLGSADIEGAEALLEAGAELNVTLPFALELCRAWIAGTEGEPLAARFDAIVARARNASIVTPEGYPGEPTVLGLATEQAIGQAILRAAALSTVANSLTISERGRDSAPVVDVGQAFPFPALIDLVADDAVWATRQARALVFGDIKGFSTIAETQHPAFFETVLGGFGDALATLGDKVEYTETAGDGIYVVLRDVISAVSACHALQRSVDPERLAAAGLSRGLGLRLSAHFGPVFEGLDRVTRRRKFFGKEVVRTARIEPVTPPGETYVTEQFAATLAFASGGRFQCDYVGRQAMAKGFGECRMYSLREVR